MFGEMFSPGQHDAEDAVLKLAENAEDAYAIVAYLSTVDWQAVIADRIQEKRGRVSSYMERRDENYRKGGGYCDACGEEYSKLFSWPFASRTSEECRPTPVLDIFFGRRDQTRTQEEISKLANEYIRDKKDYEAALWNESRSWYFHRFCWKCLRKLEEEMHVPWQYQTSRCSICDRLMLGSRKLYRIKSKNQTISCCLHCVE